MAKKNPSPRQRRKRIEELLKPFRVTDEAKKAELAAARDHLGDKAKEAAE